MALTFLGRDKFLYLIREEDDAHFVIVLNGGECECGGYLCHGVAFELTDRTEITATTHIHKQHDGQFALFFIHLDIWFIEASRYIPIDRTHIVAGLVFAHL